MVEALIPCFSCSKKAEHVVVTDDRLVLYCPEHLLERLKSSNVHTVFPVVAWKFAQTLAEFSPGLVNDFLSIEGTVRRLEAVQIQEWQLRNIKSDSAPTQPRKPQIDKEALAYVTAILKSVKEEANLPASQWQNARVILACQVLYARYLPVLLLPPGEVDYRSFVLKCDSACQLVVKLMSVLREVKKLGERESGNWYFQRKTIRRMCEAIQIIGSKVAEGKMEFVREVERSKVTLSELITQEIVENCRAIGNRPESKAKFTRNADFDRSAIQLWGEIADISLSSSHIPIATLAFIRKGEAFQSLQEYTEAEDCFQSSRDIGSADTNDLRRCTLLEVRLGLLFTEKREYVRAEQCFQTAGRLEEALEADELVEAYIGIAKTAIGLNNTQETMSILTKLDSYCLTYPTLPPIYIAESSHLIGDFYLKVNQPSQASDFLRRAVSLYNSVEAVKEHSAACRSLGCSLDQMGRYEEAVFCYRTALQSMLNTDPEYAKMQERLATIMRNSHK